LRQTQTSVLIDMNNLEHVVGAFEMARIVGRLGDCEDYEEIEKIYRSMPQVISETILQTQQFPVIEERMTAPPEYEIFARLISRSIEEPAFRSPRTQLELPTIITTNYDCAIDLALNIESVNIDYGFRDTEIPPAHLPLLKLHGSLNWFLCPGCEEFALMMLNPDIHQKQINSFLKRKTATFKRMSGMCIRCEKYRIPGGLTDPFLVPPTWRKPESGQLARVWRQAAHALSRAKYILFI
jgi:hypothetical protein